MDESECKRAAVRYDCMEWALRSAAPGDDAMMTIARAQLYADFVLAEGIPTAGFVLNLEKPTVDKG